MQERNWLLMGGAWRGSWGHENSKAFTMKKNTRIIFLTLISLAVTFSAALEPSKNKNGEIYPEIQPHGNLTFTSKFNGKVTVIDDGVHRSLLFGSRSDGAIQSKMALRNKSRLLFHYTICSTLGFVLFREPKKEVENILMIGLGGGSIPRFIRKYFPYTRIDVVDIDPLIVDIARKYFFVRQEDGLKIYIEDGRKFIETVRKTYDIVILDAFGEDNEIPSQLTSIEFLRRVKSHLSPKGILITNLIINDKKKYESAVATYRNSFKYVFRFNLETFHDANAVLISFNDDSKNIGSGEFLKRAGEFEKFLNHEYDLKKYAALLNADELIQKDVEIIHDEQH